MEDILLGTDISHWQRDVDYQALATEAKFAFIKATEGVGYEDPRFREHWKGCKGAGIPVGAYHFARVSARQRAGESRRAAISRDALSESNWFVKVCEEAGYDRDKDLPMVLDIEWDKRSNVYQLSAEERVTWCLTFLNNVESKTGVTPIVYSGPSFWRYKLGKTKKLSRFPLWMARYPKNPGLRPPTEIEGWPYTFWQFTGKGRIAGIEGNADKNYFYGTVEDLLNLGKEDNCKDTEFYPTEENGVEPSRFAVNAAIADNSADDHLEVHNSELLSSLIMNVLRWYGFK